MKRIGILTNIIPPYRIPLFNGIGRQVGLDLLCCAINEENRGWEPLAENNTFTRRLLRGGPSLTIRQSGRDIRFVYLKLGIIAYLARVRPGLLIIGDASLTSYLAAFCCRLFRIPYIWWSELLPFSPITGGALGKLRAYAISRAAHVFVSGSLARRFIEGYGRRSGEISVIPDAVDNERYLGLSRKLTPRRSLIRKDLGLPPQGIVLLYVGQFIPRKRVTPLLRAFALIAKKDRTSRLLLAGGGEEEERYRAYLEREGLTGMVQVFGFLGPERLGNLYAAADALLLLSEIDPWGMVVNEAMCFGLPVIASERVGAAADLIDERTGAILAEETINDPEQLASTIMREMARLREHATGRAVRQKVGAWNNDIAVERALEIIHTIAR